MSETILNMLPLMEEEKNAFEAAAPDAVHLYAGRRTATPEQFAQATVILGWPRPEMVAQAEHLKWFQSMFAGTDEYVLSLIHISHHHHLLHQYVQGGHR